MKIEHLDEGVGRIIKGVNTTPDVGVDQTRIEAAKFGNKVDKDGRPPTLSSAVKGKSTNVHFNLGMVKEDQQPRYTAYEWALMEGGHSLEDTKVEPKQPGDLFNALEEKWSQKYKRSINCNNPKGFSQRAHCAGRNKNEDQHPNERPEGPEFKPTMPAGTIRVKVSDVYDWYKLGQHISDLGNLNPEDFGKGPPEAVISFGSEEEEHMYVKLLQKLGLEILDVDPGAADAPGVGTDPTYNTEQIEETIRKVGSKYVIYSEKGKRLGSYSSRGAAEKRLRQIEYFKHASK